MHFPIIEFEYIFGELWSIFPFILLFVKIGHSASGGKRLVVCEGHHTVIGIHCGGQGAGAEGGRKGCDMAYAWGIPAMIEVISGWAGALMILWPIR